MDVLRRASGFLFYLLGVTAIVAIVLLQKNIAVPEITTFLNIVDLPLLFIAVIFGGTTLVTSLGRGKTPLVLFFVIFLPLIAAFALFAYLNFALPFPEF